MNLLQQVKQLKSELDDLRPLRTSDEERVMQKFRLDWNYHSNKLEGNALSYGETKALLLHGITAQGKPLKDHFEIIGHNEAIKWVLDIIKGSRRLTESFIRELHQLILKEPYEADAITPDGKPTKKTIHVGRYKQSPNHVRTSTGEIFRFAEPEETPAKMHDLLAWYQAAVERVDEHPVLLASQFHYKFIRIHPFDDGNGRCARILMNFILMTFGYPPVVIKTEDKDNYIAALRQADAGLFEPFIDFITGNLINSLEIMIKAAKGESVEESDDLDKEIALLKVRFDASGQRVETTKSVASLLDVYKKSFKPLVEYFLEKSSRLDSLYIKKRCTIFVDQMGFSDTEESVWANNANNIEADSELFKIICTHQALNKHRAGYEDFANSSGVSIELKMTHYTAKSNHADVSIDKYYGQFLTTEEIQTIVHAEIRNHVEQINSSIKER